MNQLTGEMKQSSSDKRFAGACREQSYQLLRLGFQIVLDACRDIVITYSVVIMIFVWFE